MNADLASAPWRVRVVNVERVRRKGDPPEIPANGWGVEIAWTNATAKGEPGYNPKYGSTWTGATEWSLDFPSGTGLALGTYDYSADLSGKGGYDTITPREQQSGLDEFFLRPFPTGATHTGVLKFWVPNTPAYLARPTKLTIRRDTTLDRIPFSTLRFKLNCTK
jgi:hypothetical protein